MRIKDQKSFVPNEDWTDPVGHGTQVTSVLLDMAYNAHIYVARAIRYATDTWKVDIINMSIGSYSDEGVISAAIKHAYAANVLMFAAARNDGGNFGVAFPARHKDVICISSTDGYGTPSSFNPPVFDPSDNFATIGEALPFPSFKGYPVSMSGTSYATPVAVSIASLVLAYVRENFPGGEKYEAERRLKESPDGMRAALNLMSYRIKDHRYIAPWKLFNAREGGNYVYIRLMSALKNPDFWSN
ncbi:Cell wall-associated protease [Lasiodiplodia hormozganensis]|uniref:Cell wall-associated protease n=1 Tax=Lasiodiplodia hormozganensis TaxID=869390 RepID=A0AA40CWS7_9PEZI|nr:Cell wall-associated protease [Lasiodiplodia hormozganensis]